MIEKPIPTRIISKSILFMLHPMKVYLWYINGLSAYWTAWMTDSWGDICWAAQPEHEFIWQFGTSVLQANCMTFYWFFFWIAQILRFQCTNPLGYLTFWPIQINKHIKIYLNNWISALIPIKEPYNANRQSSFVELVLVVDNGVYKKFGEDLKAVHKYCKDMVNVINSVSWSSKAIFSNF